MAGRQACMQRSKPRHFHCVPHAHAAHVNSLTSFDTEMPFEYYTLPFCKPAEVMQQLSFERTAEDQRQPTPKQREHSTLGIAALLNILPVPSLATGAAAGCEASSKLGQPRHAARGPAHGEQRVQL